MAIICPQCSEIHFNVNGDASVTECRKCQASLTEPSGILPTLELEPSAPSEQKRVKSGTPFIVIGAGLLLVAVVLGSWGAYQYTSVLEAPAVVIPQKDANNPHPSQVRNLSTAAYKVDGKERYLYPGIRMVGAKFTVYYNPARPDDASEQRPWMPLFVAVVSFLLGLVSVVRGGFNFLVTRARESDFQKAMSSTRV